MQVQMIGIDYEKADLDTRALFSFHHHASYEGMIYLKETYKLSGVVILSTCNRTEVYVSTKEERKDLLDMVCSLKDISPECYRSMVVERSGQEAIHHLFQLACGMRSKVFGEDQIITQVKDALNDAREAQTTDRNLEKIFQAAITAAKKVKSTVHLTAIKTSVIEQMKKALYKEKNSLLGVRCLVIGNGEIGRLAAACMVEEGARVTVTVRNYKTRQVEIPMGCKVLDYADRYVHLQEFDIIISATTSPHHTVKYEDCAHLLQDGIHRYLVDLAVPRDISSKFREESYVTTYDIDSLGGVSESMQDNKAVELAMEIIREQEEKLSSKKEMQEYVERIQHIGEMGADVAYKRIKKQVNQILQGEQQQPMEQQIRLGTKKTMTSLLFDMRKHMEEDQWELCLSVMKQVLSEQNF